MTDLMKIENTLCSIRSLL